MVRDIECKIGDRIRLLSMPDDPDPLPIGATGTVVTITEGPMAQVCVDWDSGRSLMLIPGVDQFEVIVAEDNLVGEDSACPQCRNRDVDRLVWDKEYGEFVTCMDCRMVYGPDGAPYEVSADSSDGEREPIPSAVSAMPGDLVTLTAEPFDPCPALVGSTGTAVFVAPGPPPHVLVRWMDGGSSKLYPGLDSFRVASTFVGCHNPGCGNDNIEMLGRDPASGIVTCIACGWSYDPEAERRKV
jgi:hypothetical protein